MKRTLLVSMIVLLFSFGLSVEAGAAGLPSLGGLEQVIVRKVERGIQKGISGQKEEKPTRAETPQQPERKAEQPQAQRQPSRETPAKVEQSQKPAAASAPHKATPTTKSTAAKAPAAPKEPPVPMTLEQFKAKAKDYEEDKIKPKDFISMCDKALKDAEASGDKEFIINVLFQRSYARSQVGDRPGAHADADKAIEIAPESDKAYLAKAIAFEMEGNVQGFVDYATKAAEFVQDEEKKKALLQIAKDFPLIKSAIAPGALWKAFNENEVAAEDAYKGKLVSIKGRISEITTSLTGYPQLTFSFGNYGMNSVFCEFPKDARPEIAKLKKGQEVTIAGVCKGMMVKNVIMSGCRIIQ